MVGTVGVVSIIRAMPVLRPVRTPSGVFLTEWSCYNVVSVVVSLVAMVVAAGATSNSVSRPGRYPAALDGASDLRVVASLSSVSVSAPGWGRGATLATVSRVLSGTGSWSVGRVRGVFCVCFVWICCSACGDSCVRVGVTLAVDCSLPGWSDKVDAVGWYGAG